MNLRHIHPKDARAYLIGQTGLRANQPESGFSGVRAMLKTLRCIQLDPLDRIGTNADLVAMARVDGLRRGDVYQALLPGFAFEHFAKERCILPASAFPYYRGQAVETPWWRHSERMKRLPDDLLDSVLDEIRSRGPTTSAELSDRGRVKRLNWNGWGGTSRAATLALEVLWTRCQVVVHSRTPQGKRFEVPERALPEVAAAPTELDFARWAVLERVEAAGLLSRASGPHWSMLSKVRTSGLPDQLVAEGLLEEVEIHGSRRRYLAPAGFLDRTFPDDDGRMRILGPLDPILWDRKLVAHIWGFSYVWEVYKPESKRIWGYYVCPLLHQGRLVGRFEGHTEEGALAIDRLWKQDGESFDDQAWRSAQARHSEGLAQKSRP